MASIPDLAPEGEGQHESALFGDDLRNPEIMARHSAQAICLGLHKYKGRWRSLNSISEMLRLIELDGFRLAADGSGWIPETRPDDQSVPPKDD